MDPHSLAYTASRGGTDPSTEAASERVAAYLREAIFSGGSRREARSGRRRSPTTSGRAGCRCARRCGCSRRRA